MRERVDLFIIVFPSEWFFHDAYAIILENIKQRKMKIKNIWYKWEFKVKLVSSSDLNARREEILNNKLVLNMWNRSHRDFCFAFSTDFSRIVYCTD